MEVGAGGVQWAVAQRLRAVPMVVVVRVVAVQHSRAVPMREVVGQVAVSLSW